MKKSQCSYQRQNSVEFRKRGVNHCIGLYVVSLGNTHNTASTNLSLTDSGEQAYQPHTQSDAQHQRAVRSKIPAHGHDVQTNTMIYAALPEFYAILALVAALMV